MSIPQVIPNVKSRDQIGKAGAKSLLDYFVRQFGSEGSYAFKQAQYAFASSLAGYAVVCYLMNIKVPASVISHNIHYLMMNTLSVFEAISEFLYVVIILSFFPTFFS
jgi:hypothetical protein